MFVLGNHDSGLNTHGLAYSPRSHLLASAKVGVKLWDLAARKLAREIPSVGEASSVAFGPDGQLVVANGGQFAPIQIFDPETGTLLREFAGTCKTQCAVFSPDGLTLVIGGHDHRDGGKVGHLVRWNLATGHKRWPLVGHEDDVGFIVFSPNGKRLATGSSDGKAFLWDLAKRTVLVSSSCRPSWRVVAFSPDGRTLAITAEKAIEVWDTHTLKKTRTLRGHKGTVNGIAFTADGRLVSGAADGLVRLWEPGSGKERACLDWKIGPVQNIAVAPDGLTASAGSLRGDIVIWDLEGA